MASGRDGLGAARVRTRLLIRSLVLAGHGPCPWTMPSTKGSSISLAGTSSGCH
jgi:hypothetical protein